MRRIFRLLFTVILLGGILCAVMRSMDVQFPLFMSTNVLELNGLLTLCLPLVAVGAVLIIIGRFVEKRYFTFN